MYIPPSPQKKKKKKLYIPHWTFIVAAMQVVATKKKNDEIRGFSLFTISKMETVSMLINWVANRYDLSTTKQTKRENNYLFIVAANLQLSE